MKKVLITDYGAKQNGELQTEYIQKAIDDCFLSGAGEVIVPAGIYRTGGLRLRSNVTLHLLENAELEGSRDPDDYFMLYNDAIEPVDPAMLSRNPRTSNQGKISEYFVFGGRWYNALIRAYQAENVTIIGEKGSKINGMDCYDEGGEEAYRGPHAICMIHCNNIRLSGYEIVNSSNWAHSMWFCNNIELGNITVNGGHDGCHFRFSKNIHVHDCHFSTGDDCVAGYNIKNIVVENCEMNTACSAFRLGPTNALIQNCHVYGPPKHLFRWIMPLEDKIAGVHEVKNESNIDHMLSFFTYASVAEYTKENPKNENVIFRNCKIENVERFMHFNFSGNEPWQSGCPLTEVKFENIDAVGIKMPLVAYGDQEKHIDITMENMNINFKEGFEDAALMKVANFERIYMKNVSSDNFKGTVLIQKYTDDSNIIVENSPIADHCTISELQEEKFECQPI